MARCGGVRRLFCGRGGDPGGGHARSATGSAGRCIGADASARPEWYFLFLFRLLHLEIFGGARQIIPAMILPGLAFGFLILMPLVARWKFGHRLNVIAVVAGVAGYAVLTGSDVVSRTDAIRPIRRRWRTRDGTPRARVRLPRRPTDCRPMASCRCWRLMR